MKILLVGEFSGLHNALRDGLQKLGHEAVLFSGGDGFKDFPTDLSWRSKYTGYLGALDSSIKALKQLPVLKGFDIVQFINAEIFLMRFGFNEKLIKALMRKSPKSFLVVAGELSAGWKYWHDPTRNNIKYTWIPDLVKYDLNGKLPQWLKNSSHLKWEKEMMDRVNAIIPVMYEYAQPYRSYKNLATTTPLPVNIDKIVFQENKVQGKLVVYHGITRYGMKGTKYVEEAFGILQKKYPNDLELIINQKIPFTEYSKLIDKVNVIIDQTNSYSLGINALIAMAKGKVLMGGAEPEGIDELGYKSCPAINILPNAKHIVTQVENLLDTKSHIKDIGAESRAFVVANHHYVDIARKYVDIWSS